MGIRPINNIVDITNYVMEEYGQPMHAYDLDKIRGHKIVVKRANDGDVYTTLDGQERKLDKEKIKHFTIMNDIFMRNVLKEISCTEYILQVIMNRTGQK